jgi:hypothetical protein
MKKFNKAMLHFTEAMRDAIGYSRNGYFHKDNMPAKEVSEIREQTYFLYLLILGSLTLSDENISDLMN